MMYSITENKYSGKVLILVCISLLGILETANPVIRASVSSEVSKLLTSRGDFHFTMLPGNTQSFSIALARNGSRDKNFEIKFSNGIYHSIFKQFSFTFNDIPLNSIKLKYFITAQLATST